MHGLKQPLGTIWVNNYFELFSFLTQENIGFKLSEIMVGSRIQDLGSGIRKKPIPDPGSRGQKGTGSRIPDPDPQHWLKDLLGSVWGMP
jgi:hypothetical protein